MRRIAIAFVVGIFLLAAIPAQASQKLQGWCEDGGALVQVAGVTSSTATRIQRSYVSAAGTGCGVTVYMAGTTSLATIYADNAGTLKANPFTASSTGQWFFYAANGHYDVTLSGAGIPTPFTIGDVLLSDSSSSPFYIPTSTVAGLSATTTDGQIDRVTNQTKGLWLTNGTNWFQTAHQVIDVQDYGAKADVNAVSDGSMSNGTAIVTSATAAWVAADVGKYITVAGAGVAGANISGTITVRNSATSVTISNSASTTVSNALIRWATNDTTAIQNAFNAAYKLYGDRSYDTEIRFPRAEYWANGLILRNASPYLSSSVTVTGNGIGNTVITRLPGDSTTNPLLTIGGSAAGVNSTNLILRDIKLDGNKSYESNASYSLYLERTDRTTVDRVFVQNSKTSSNIYVKSSTVTFHDTESYDSDSHGVLLDGAEVKWTGGFINTNAGYGLYCQWVDQSIFVARNALFADFSGVHFEQNGATGATGGPVYNNGCDYLYVRNSVIQTLAGNTNPLVEYAANSHWGRVIDNDFNTGNWDFASRSDDTQIPTDFYIIKFANSTYGSVYSNNRIHPSVANLSPGTNINLLSQIQDLGSNYSYDPQFLSINQIVSKEGSAQAGGWVSTPTTTSSNFVLSSDDLTTGWTVTGAVTTANVTTYGNPAHPSGTATAVTFAASVANSSIQQQVTWTLASNQQFTLSAFMYNPNYVAGTASDVRMRVCDDASCTTIYADVDVRVQNKWDRFTVSGVNTTGGNIVNPFVQVYKAQRSGGPSRLIAIWRVQFQPGGLMPPAPSASATVAAPAILPGFAAMNLTAFNGLTVGTATGTASTGISSVTWTSVAVSGTAVIATGGTATFVVTASASTNIQFSGAAIGDWVQVAHDNVSVSLLILNGVVSAANTIQVTAYNLGGATSIGAGNLMILVTKRRSP